MKFEKHFQTQSSPFNLFRPPDRQDLQFVGGRRWSVSWKASLPTLGSAQGRFMLENKKFYFTEINKSEFPTRINKCTKTVFSGPILVSTTLYWSSHLEANHNLPFGIFAENVLCPQQSIFGPFKQFAKLKGKSIGQHPHFCFQILAAFLADVTINLI